ncbi:MAG: hypothetical protein M1380_07010, partial [Chloroflexi bacterium]|nr:hypothetical protein [Chloroflexota bacterium]
MAIGTLPPSGPTSIRAAREATVGVAVGVAVAVALAVGVAVGVIKPAGVTTTVGLVAVVAAGVEVEVGLAAIPVPEGSGLATVVAVGVP